MFIDTLVIPQVKATKLITLPVPWLAELKTKWDDLAALAERMLTTNRQLQSARTPDEKTRLARQADAIDRRMDELVYELYGLGDNEIAIVEGASR